MEFTNINEEMIYIKKRNQFIKELELFIELRGFTKVDVDFFEPYEKFIEQNKRIKKETMVKVLDPKGRISILRPDITTNIIEQVIYKWVDDAKLKLYYDAFIFRQTDGALEEKRQFGIEQLGFEDGTAEVDVLNTVIALLEEYQIDYKIRLGSGAFINILLKELSWEKETLNQLKNALQAKNETALHQIINAQTTKNTSYNVLKDLLTFEGQINDVLNQLSTYQLSPDLASSFNRLTLITKQLKSPARLWVDLSLIPEYDYYDGLVLEGYTKNLSTPLFQGGRYDKLTAQHGKNINAFGISFDFQALIKEVTNNERLGKQTISFLKEAKIITSLDTNSRKLKIYDQTQNISYLFIKPADIATYVEQGVADLGIVGKDTLLEQNKDVYELLPLRIGKCIVAVAGFEETVLKPSKETLTIASKYPNITKTYFTSINQPIKTIYLNGSVELAPLMGLSDVIVDIVETGSTLKANNLTVLETIMSVEAMLIASKTNYQFQYTRIKDIMKMMKEAII